MSHELLLSNTYRHPCSRVLPPPNPPPGVPEAKACSAEDSILPTQREPGNGMPPPVLSLPLLLPWPRLLEGPYERSHIGLSPPELGNTAASPPHEKPPPGGRGGPQNHTFHPQAIQDAYDKFPPHLPGPGRSPPHVPDEQHLLHPAEEGEGVSP